MNERLVQMRAEIEKLKCSDVLGLNEQQMSDSAQRYASKYSAAELPKIERAAAVKTGEVGDRYWTMPYTGDKTYLSHSILGCPNDLGLEKIEPDRMFVRIADGPDIPAEEAESKAERVLGVIEKALTLMKQERDENFSSERFKELALSVLTRKRDSCAKLKAAGYSVR